jgi:chromate reductase
MTQPTSLLGFAGSLRKNSYNKLLLEASRKLLPDYVTMESFDISRIPLYNQDTEVAGIPEPVKDFKERIQNADAILIATPEYNHSYPGVLKNAIDWASRPYGNNSFSGKPAAVISASPGTFGGFAAREQLKQVLLALNMHLTIQPAVVVASAHQKFDQNGDLVDSDSVKFLKQLLANLVSLANLISDSKHALLHPIEA